MKINFKLTEGKESYINRHYSGDDDIMVGLFTTEMSAREACALHYEVLGEGWNVGDFVNGKEVESISFRIDHQDDHFNRSDVAERGENESYVEYINRIAEYFFYTACICRRFRNTLNDIMVFDDEINGATPVSTR